ncbi:hypothetical protein BSL78_13774 [Apostichopus japonicus]|uniref:Uncharacterized protein n=1 Tax=Stichopus japonicus TaxID=307972 RepID=A0A2G8KMX3_STIJA|nr:hypothetical protein BSL78_13774 [Apostichopus japonicus]
MQGQELWFYRKMEACQNVERDVDKVLNKFSSARQHINKNIDELLENMETMKEDLLSSGPPGSEVNQFHSSIFRDTLKRSREMALTWGGNHKDIHSSVSKVGKTIDKNFSDKLLNLSKEPTFENTKRMALLNKVINEHFLRQGMLDIADSIAREADLDIPESVQEPFIEIHRILAALKEQNLRPALKWAEARRDMLRQQNSSLEFKLHRLQFIELIQQGSRQQQEILLYARRLAPFANQHPKEFQILMGSLLFLNQGLKGSPYEHLLEPINLIEICDVFVQDACTLLGLSVESPLAVSLTAGCKSLPSLLNIMQVMQSSSVMWSAKEELPIEIDIGASSLYHSIFACPILRQQTTQGNPPMRLSCGHAISRESLNKLVNGNKIKCPLCPVESSPDEAKQLYM